MALFFDSLLVDVLAILVTFFSLVYAYFQYSYTYWDRKNVPYLTPSFPFGNMTNQILLRESPGEINRRLYRKLKAPGRRFGGIYTFHRPFLMLLDPEMVKNVMSRDFEYFHDRNIFVDEKTDPLSGHLVALKGVKWKNLRAKLTPTFTSGKMKMMFETIASCSGGLDIILDQHVANNEAIDIKDILGRFTTDIIGSCAFGIECNSLKDPNAVFRMYGKKIFEPSNWTFVKIMLSNTFPKLFPKLGLKRHSDEVIEFFTNVVKETVAYREMNSIQRADFMQLLIQMKNNNEDTKVEESEAGKSLSINEMTAQAFVFFLAGFETSSTTMTFTLFDLALNQDIQDKVRAEVEAMYKKYDGKLCYEGIMELTYMDKVVQESQRLHAPIPQLARICTKAYKIPGTDIIIEKDTTVMIPVYGMQTDPEFYPEPEKYDPERFSPEQKANRHPYTFLPFGEGPRNCIGLRFGLLQTKVGLAVVLRRHRIRLSPKTKTPIEFSPKNFIFSVKGDVWLTAEKI